MLVFFGVTNYAYHRYDGQLSIILACSCLILINMCFNLTAINTDLMIRNGDQCEQFKKEILKKSNEVFSSESTL